MFTQHLFAFILQSFVAAVFKKTHTNIILNVFVELLWWRVGIIVSSISYLTDAFKESVSVIDLQSASIPEEPTDSIPDSLALVWALRCQIHRLLSPCRLQEHCAGAAQLDTHACINARTYTRARKAGEKTQTTTQTADTSLHLFLSAWMYLWFHAHILSPLSSPCLASQTDVLVRELRRTLSE